MDKQAANPWKWQDQFGFVQANLVSGERVLYCSGQTSVDENSVPVHAGDMAAEVAQAFNNAEEVLKEADMGLHNIVKINVYTTDVDAFFQGYGVVVERMAKASARFASTLLGVQRLAFPELMVELEITAVA